MEQWSPVNLSEPKNLITKTQNTHTTFLMNSTYGWWATGWSIDDNTNMNMRIRLEIWKRIVHINWWEIGCECNNRPKAIFLFAFGKSWMPKIDSKIQMLWHPNEFSVWFCERARINPYLHISPMLNRIQNVINPKILVRSITVVSERKQLSKQSFFLCFYFVKWKGEEKKAIKKSNQVLVLCNVDYLFYVLELMKMIFFCSIDNELNMRSMRATIRSKIQQILI